MATFFMFGKYSPEALKGISANRTNEAIALIKRFGGEVTSMHALLGSEDIILIVELPGVKEAVQASVALSRSTGIAFTTSPAIRIEEFDTLISQV